VPVKELDSRHSLSLEIKMDMSVSVSNAPKKLLQQSEEESLLLNSQSSQSEEDIGETRSVNHIPSLEKLTEDVDPFVFV